MFKKPILLRRLNETEQYLGKVVIGVVGIEHGVGTTHLAILLAHYYHKWLHRKTIFIEWGQNEVGFLNKDLDDEHILEGHLRNKKLPKHNSYEKGIGDKDISYKAFHMKGIDWYTYVHQRDISSIMGTEYECAIIDFGTQYNKAFDELLRCNYKIIVGHHALWKQYHLRNFIERIKEYYNHNWLCILPYMEEKELQNLNKSIPIRCYTFPFEPNPFHLSSNSLLALEKLFQFH